MKTTIDIRNHPAPATYLLENKTLGWLIANPYAIPEARKWINADTFSDDNGAHLWALLLEEYDAGHDISVEGMYSRINSDWFRRNVLDYAAAGSVPPMELLDTITALRAAAFKRRAYFVAVQMLQATSGSADIEEVVSIPRDFLADSQGLFLDGDAQRVGDVMNELGDVITRRAAAVRDGRPLRVPTGFRSVDWLTYGGFAKGNLVILAARPSVGKTAVMLQSALAAAQAGIPASVYSLEMTNIELAQRITCALSPIRQADIARGDIAWDAFEYATGKVAGLPLWLNDKAHSLDEITTKIAAAHRRGECDAAFIDYLGLISYRDDRRSLYQQVTEATRRLKLLAKSADIPVVLLCQLNRDMSKEGRAPQLHDLRDSGSIEQDADIVLMLERDLAAASEDDPGRTINMYVRKNRQGRVGDCITLEANESFTTFTEVTSINH